jgi:Peptidase family S41/N-terminal domain of Peptidase_S41 in eukaryotic IRBP
MNEIAKFDVQLVHQGTSYKVGLREANENDTMKFQVAGRTVTPFEYTPLPANLKEIFASLDKTTFSSEKELIKKLKKDSDVNCFSVTKKVYELGTFQLVQNQTTESKYGLTTKESTYQSLRSCLSSDNSNISSIIHSSKLPESTLFEIADKIEHDDRNISLAHAVREASRSFNLGSAVEHLCENMTTHCIKGESAEQMAAGLRKKLLNGDYEHIYEEDDFANAVTQDLQAISHNRHVFVLPKPPNASTESDIPSNQIHSDEERIKELEASNFGFGELRTLPKGTAYLDILSFENPKELIANKPLARDFAMAILKQIVDSKPEALIIDLRKHGGGSVYMSELVLSHFLEEELPLTGFEYKEPPQGEELRSFPLEPCQTWSYEQLPKDQRLLDVPIYVLTSHETFSAGEDIACHLKERGRGRATLIGETTGGGGDPNKLFDAQEFLIAMPVGFAKVPYGPSWEGIGVTPHIQIENGQDAELIANQLIAERK